MNIPLVNLSAQYKTISHEVDRAIKKVSEKGDFILGGAVDQFEQSFAKYLGVRYCIGVGSGTDAIKLMLQVAGIGRGDEVIVQANTFIASLLPIIELGAKPILVDCNPDTGAINVTHVPKVITKHTRAVLPVHLFGLPAPLNELSALLNTHAINSNLLLLEDACQAHGSSVNGKKCGSFGEMAAFSFYPGKNLGAFGDGGAVVTNSKKYAEAIRIIRNIGMKKKYDHVRLGTNSRLDTIHAAVLSVKLKHLDAWNRKRNKIAKQFIHNLMGVGDLLLPPTPPSDIVENYHLFVIRTKKRDALVRHLHKNGIHPLIHYPVPLHLTPALKFLGHKKGDFPASEVRASTMISLPLYAELREKEVSHIVTTIKKFYSSPYPGKHK